MTLVRDEAMSEIDQVPAPMGALGASGAATAKEPAVTGGNTRMREVMPPRSYQVAPSGPTMRYGAIIARRSTASPTKVTEMTPSGTWTVRGVLLRSASTVKIRPAVRSTTSTVTPSPAGS